MGHGLYSHSSRATRALDEGYHIKDNSQIFKSRSCPKDMDPMNLGLRESRDSEDHPNSLPIIVGLDVTGSMGALPQHIVRDGLPNIIKKMQNNGIADPQILFLGVGDHVYDSAPIQVGQFESSDELLDKWLTQVYLEGGGGGNVGESYLLGWLIGARHTVTDSMEKRGQKGFLFTIGDEPLLDHIDAKSLKNIFGDQYQGALTLEEIYKEASENYHVVHFFTSQTGAGQSYQDGSWVNGAKKLLGQDLVFIDNVDELADQIAEIVSARTGDGVTTTPPKQETSKEEDSEIML